MEVAEGHLGIYRRHDGPNGVLSGHQDHTNDNDVEEVHRTNREEDDILSLPLSVIKRFIISMASQGSSGSSSAGRPRGRRASVKVPCDGCIKRASENKDESSIQLCERCLSVLHRPRRRQEQPNVRKVRRQSNAIIDAALGVRTDPVTLPWSEDRHEQHALQFFVRHSAPQLAGYFDSPFWQRMVLQAGRNEPAVKHAIAAVGALHEKLLTGAVNPNESQDRRTQFALEQCNKSIQHLLKPKEGTQRPDLRLMLTTCVLFTCFEALQGHCEAAIQHATQGYSLIQQYAMDPENERWDIGAFAVELDQLTLMMRRLQTQSKGLMGKEYNIVPDSEQMSMQKPTLFNSLHDARVGLELVMNKITVFFLDLELDDQFYDLVISNAEKHLIFSPWLEAWERAFSALLARNQARMTTEDRKAAMILKAHHLVAEILSNVDLSLAEIGWDSFHDKFVAIVDLATAVLEGTPQADTSVIEARWKTGGVFISAANTTLSFSLGIVDPLYEVVSRCRDPVLRRKALDLLARHPRQECMWSSWSAWKVGKYLMRLEEEGSGESPPARASDVRAEARISEAWLDFSNPAEARSSAQVRYKKAVPPEKVRYALNPGLFDGRSEHDFEQPIDFATVRPDSSAFGMTPTTPAQSSSAEAAQFHGDPSLSTWVHYGEGESAGSSLSPVHERPER